MLRAIVLSLALLIGLGTIIPLATDMAEAGPRKKKRYKKKKKVRKYSKRWWQLRRKRARLRKARAKRRRARRLRRARLARKRRIARKRRARLARKRRARRLARKRRARLSRRRRSARKRRANTRRRKANARRRRANARRRKANARKRRRYTKKRRYTARKRRSTKRRYTKKRSTAKRYRKKRTTVAKKRRTATKRRTVSKRRVAQQPVMVANNNESFVDQAMTTQETYVEQQQPLVSKSQTNYSKKAASKTAAKEGWINKGISKGAIQFNVQDDRTNTKYGSASVSVIGSAVDNKQVINRRIKTVGGVTTTALRRTVIDEMIREEGWVVNDYQKEVNGNNVYVVVAQAPDKNNQVENRMYYFTEADGKIYKVATKAPEKGAEQLAEESEKVINSLHPRKVVQPQIASNRAVIKVDENNDE